MADDDGTELDDDDDGTELDDDDDGTELDDVDILRLASSCW